MRMIILHARYALGKVYALDAFSITRRGLQRAIQKFLSLLEALNLFQPQSIFSLKSLLLLW